MASSDPYYNRVKPPSGYKTVYNTDGRGVSWLNTKTQKCHNPETIMKPPPKAAPSLSLVRSNKKRQLLSFSDREDALVSAETEAVCLDDYEAGRPDELREKFLCFVKNWRCASRSSTLHTSSCTRKAPSSKTSPKTS